MLAAVQLGTGDVRWGFAFVFFSISIAFVGILRLDVVAGTAHAAAAVSHGEASTGAATAHAADDGVAAHDDASELDASVTVVAPAAAEFATAPGDTREVSAGRSLL